MKATELMIGDWVLFGDEPLKVQHIYNNGYDDVVAEITEESFNEYGVCEEIRDVPSVNCSPIPLTPEILKKNGWKDYGNFMDIVTDEGTHLSWGKDKYGVVIYQDEYYICECKYVHTLQHAIRLCGLNELADNFKV